MLELFVVSSCSGIILRVNKTCTKINWIWLNIYFASIVFEGLLLNNLFIQKHLNQILRKEYLTNLCSYYIFLFYPERLDNAYVKICLQIWLPKKNCFYLELTNSDIFMQVTYSGFHILILLENLIQINHFPMFSKNNNKLFIFS